MTQLYKTMFFSGFTSNIFSPPRQKVKICKYFSKKLYNSYNELYSEILLHSISILNNIRCSHVFFCKVPPFHQQISAHSAPRIRRFGQTIYDRLYRPPPVNVSLTILSAGYNSSSGVHQWQAVGGGIAGHP